MMMKEIKRMSDLKPGYVYATCWKDHKYSSRENTLAYTKVLSTSTETKSGELVKTGSGNLCFSKLRWFGPLGFFPPKIYDPDPKKASTRKMPRKQEIADYWLPILQRMGLEIDNELSLNIQCFTCGRYGPKLERCHIRARCEGGSDEVKNLHILCGSCHEESEFLNGKKYWKWYRHKRTVGFYEVLKQDTAIHSI